MRISLIQVDAMISPPKDERVWLVSVPVGAEAELSVRAYNLPLSLDDLEFPGALQECRSMPRKLSIQTGWFKCLWQSYSAWGERKKGVPLILDVC